LLVDAAIGHQSAGGAAPAGGVVNPFTSFQGIVFVDFSLKACGEKCGQKLQEYEANTELERRETEPRDQFSPFGEKLNPSGRGLASVCWWTRQSVTKALAAQLLPAG